MKKEEDIQFEGGDTVENSAMPLKNIELSATKVPEMDKGDMMDPENEEKQLRVELPITNIDQLEIDEAVNAVAYKKDDKRNMQSIIALEEKVNYIELMAYIQSTHPTVEVPVVNQMQDQDYEPQSPFRYFYLTEPLGSLAPKLPCRKTEDDEGKPVTGITEMAKQLGLGPSLFLMSTKAFAWFFLVLSLINIPVLIFFGTGNSAGPLERPTDLFAILSMGNVGQSGYACNSAQVQEMYVKDPGALGYNAKEQEKEYERYGKIRINCGIGSKIKSLVQIGMSKDKSTSCKGIYDKPADYANAFNADCSYENSTQNTLFDYDTQNAAMKEHADVFSLIKSADKKDVKMLNKEMDCLRNYTGKTLDFASLWFQCHCIGESDCTMPALTYSPKFTYLWTPGTSTSSDVEKSKFVMFQPRSWLGYTIKDTCYEKLRAESVLQKENPQMIALATCVSPDIKNPFTGNEWNKDSLGVFVVFFDVGSVIAMILFTKALISTQEDYVKEFDKATIQMTDFTLRVQNIPHHLLYGNKDEFLRAMLTSHFQEVLKDEMKVQKEEAKLLNKQDDDFDNLTSIDPQLGSDTLEALDFEIADINFGKGDMTTMNYLMTMSDLQNIQTRNQIKKAMLPANSSSCFGDDPITKIEKQEVKLNWQFEKLRDLYLEEIKMDKKIDFNAEEREKELEEDPEIRYAYITFRSMDAVDLIKSSYRRYGYCQRCCIMNCHPACCKKTRADIQKKYICKQYPLISNAVTPDSINWQNLGYGQKYRSFMTCVNWIIAIAMIVASLIFIIILKQKTLELKKEFNTNIVCPSESTNDLFKSKAWADQQLPTKERLGLMHCFCFGNLMKDGTSVRNIKFTEFQKYNETLKKEAPDDTPYCEDWLYNYGAQQSAVIFTSLVVVVINIIASIVLTLSVTIERNHTVNDETMGQFMKLTILQFINIGLIILIINFDFTETNEDGSKALFLGFLPIFNGQFKDFNSEWYSQIGKTLCLTLLLNIFTPHISKVTLPFLKIYKRCSDRGCSRTIWKQKKTEADIDVNTKLLLQSDINMLYTGDQIQSHYVYAQNYTYLCVVLMYSSGLPILYPFAALFYFVLYWVYKGLLLKYYARTTKFNEDIPIQSMTWVKFGLFMHLFIGSIMLSNQNFFPPSKESAFLDTSQFTDQLDTDELALNDDMKQRYDQFFVAAYFERLESGSQSTIYLTFIVLIFVAWLLINLLGIFFNFFSFLRRPILICLSFFTCCCKQKHKEVKSKDIYKEFDVLSLESMLTKAQDDLDDFHKAADELDKGGSTISHMENRYDAETDYNLSSIVEIYERRIKQIENVCDDHLLHLHGLENLNQHFKHLKPEEKLRYLLLKQQFVHKDERMRMVDITQSYNIYDSIAFKKTKSLQEKIETNEKFNLVSKV